MKLRILVFPLFIVGLAVLFFSAGRSSCACGDVPPPEPITIAAPAI